MKILAAFGLLTLCALSGRRADTPALARGDLWGIRLQDSLAECKRKIPLRQLRDEEVRHLLQLSPFYATLSFLDPARIAFWSNDKTNFNGWPNFLVAEFSTSKKEKLVDLFNINFGHLTPAIDGKYQSYLHSLQRGTSVAEIYRHLGNPSCSYEQRDGVWRLIFIYPSGRGFWGVLADPATGTVIDSRDVTI